VIAAGSELEDHDAKLMFLDTRTSQLIASFDESHSDDITEISYHPTIRHHLISASTDGLICQFDTSTYDEEENITSVINSGSSVSKAGYFGPSAEYIYCLTHIETLSLHNVEVCT
jgi:WD40 repeat protein